MTDEECITDEDLQLLVKFVEIISKENASKD
jgi:hypothetical protein